MSVATALSLSRRLLLGFAALGLLWGSFAAQAPEIKAWIGADDALFGLLLLGGPVGLLTTIWVAPRFDARLGDRALPCAAAALACAFLLPGMVTTPGVFLVAMVSMGLASGLADIVVNARVSELEAHHGRPLMNANHGVFSVAYGVSALLTGAAREAAFSSFAIFASMSILVLVAVPWMRVQAMPAPGAARRGSGFPLGMAALCGGIALTAFFVEAAIEGWAALHVERTLGGRAAQGALGPAILGFTMAAGRLSGQAIAERFSDLAIVALGSGMACGGAFLAAAAPTPLVAYIGFAAAGLGVSVVGPNAIALAGRLAPPAQRVRMVAFVVVMGYAAFIAAPAVVGLVSGAFGLRTAFAVVGALALIAPLLTLALGARQAQSP